MNDLLAATRFSGAGAPQQQTIVFNPTCFSAVSLSDALNQGCASTPASRTVSTAIQIDPTYRSPVTQQLGTSLERQLNKSTALTFTYLHSFGVHQMVTRNANAPYLAGYNSSLGNIDEYDPEAVFKQNQIIVNVNAHFTPNFSLMGFYNMTAANTDSIGGIASNSANLSQDYGRASWASRNMVFMMANYQGPWGIRFNPFLIAQSGRPFNIVTNQDLGQDGFFESSASVCNLCVGAGRRGPDQLWRTRRGSATWRSVSSCKSGQRSRRGGREPSHQPRLWARSQT